MSRGTCLLCSVLVASLAALMPLRARADEAVTALGAGAFAARFESDNPRLHAIDGEVDARRAEATGAALWSNPSLSYEREDVHPGGKSAAENTVTLGWTLDLSGRRSRRVSAARARVLAADALADDTRLVALLDALGAYYDGAHARLRLDALRVGREPLARAVEAVGARVRAGDVAGYDAIRLELELASYDDRVAAAEIELEAARRRLGGLLGEPAARYDASDELALPEVQPDPGALVSEALAARGDYRATAFEESSADAALSAAERGWIPLLDLGLGLKTADLGTDTATGYYGMIGIELPLLSRGQADAERARADRRVARARRGQLERAISADVQVAYARLAGAVERAEAARAQQLPRARALVSRAEAAYQSGEGPFADLLDAHRTSVDVHLRYLDHLRGAKQAELDLLRALGRRPARGSQ